MQKKSSQRNGIARWAPALATAMVSIGAILAGGVGVAQVEGTEEYMASVRRMVENVPYHIGPWIGQDVPMTEPARRMLRPNIVLSRKFIDLESRNGFSLLIVHCKDVRDMIGHYPPVCYPGQGFDMTDLTDVTVDEASAYPRSDLLPGPDVLRRYSFAKSNEIPETKLIVYNFFAKPTGDQRFALDMNTIESISSDRRLSGLGSAQIQIVMFESVDQTTREHVVNEVLETLQPAMNAIIAGPTPQSEKQS